MNEIMMIKIPDKAAHIISTLEENGYEAYAVGGCVRDACLGRIPKDWDITTSADPAHVKQLFYRTIDTGIEHGTVTVMLGREGFEVTTYRIDGDYEDGRHPKQVAYTKNLEEDLKRRDFTINAMAYSPERGLIDIFDGAGDLESKIIRCVGKPGDRFQEDGLRMLRAVRFSGQLGFHIEGETLQAICSQAESINRISAERIREELDKLFLSPHPEYIKKAYETGLTAIVLPEFNRMMETPQNNPHHIYGVGDHTIKTMQAMQENKEKVSEKQYSILMWTMLFHDVGKPARKQTDDEGIDHFYGHAELGADMAEEILRRLKFDNDTIHTAARLIKWHDSRFKTNSAAIRRAMNRVGDDIIELLLMVQKADALGQSLYMKSEKIDRITKAAEQIEIVRKTGSCITLKDLKVNGRDLLNIGIPSGKQIGLCLGGLLSKVLDDPELNDRETLLGLASALYKNSLE